LSVVVVSGVEVTETADKLEAGGGTNGLLLLDSAVRGLNTQTPTAITASTTIPPIMAGFFHAPGFSSSSS
jgi:hypothetical protein